MSEPSAKRIIKEKGYICKVKWVKQGKKENLSGDNDTLLHILH